MDVTHTCPVTLVVSVLCPSNSIVYLRVQENHRFKRHALKNDRVNDVTRSFLMRGLGAINVRVTLITWSYIFAVLRGCEAPC